MLKHKHHIIPRHAGGTDDPSNIIELTVEQHAEAHRLLYEQHGRLGDYLAWKGLSGAISTAEIVWLKLKARRGPLHHLYGTKRPAHSALMKGRFTGVNNPMFGRVTDGAFKPGNKPWNKGKDCPHLLGNKHAEGNKGKVQSEEWKRKRLDKIKGPHETAICPVCGKEGGIRSMKRWHGLNGERCRFITEQAK